MLERLTRETFAQHLNTGFRLILGPGQELGLELTEAKDLGSTPDHEQFSVVFRGPLDPQLGQGIYRIEHDRLDAFDLFIVPVGQDRDGMYYEAIFNRPR